MRQLHCATAGFADSTGLSDLFGTILDAAIALADADFGNVQLVDPESGALRIVAHYGFGPDFLEYFAVVDDTASACGRSAATGEQVVIGDTRTDPAFAPHREIAVASRFRSVQSTPLLTYRGELIGMVSTHSRRLRHCPDGVLPLLRLFGDAAGDAIAARLDPADTADPIGRALMTALLAPPGAATGAVLGTPAALREVWTARLANAPHANTVSAGPQITLSDFADGIVNRVFSVGLTLHGARSLLPDGPVAARVDTAVERLDETIRQIYSDMLHIVTDELPHPPQPETGKAAAQRFTAVRGG